jgi:16S rRNA (guanine1207-N2)-methyltransferase
VSPDTPSGHYFETNPSTTSRRRSIPLVLPDLSLELESDRGVFAVDRIDPGTRLLLLDAPAPAASATEVLDLGCGYGPIAITLAKRAPTARVWALDVNERARQLTRDNATRLELDNVRVVTPDEIPEEVMFDGVWSNPPVRIGKGPLHELLARWIGRLAPGGHAYLVVAKQLGADSLQRWLVEQGWPTRRRASRAGYRVLDIAGAAT